MLISEDGLADVCNGAREYEYLVKDAQELETIQSFFAALTAEVKKRQPHDSTVLLIDVRLSKEYGLRFLFRPRVIKDATKDHEIRNIMPGRVVLLLRPDKTIKENADAGLLFELNGSERIAAAVRECVHRFFR